MSMETLNFSAIVQYLTDAKSVSEETWNSGLVYEVDGGALKIMIKGKIRMATYKDRLSYELNPTEAVILLEICTEIANLIKPNRPEKTWQD